LIVFGGNYIEHAHHVSDAQKSGIPAALTYLPGGHRPQWYRYKAPCMNKPAGTDCDEYPYRTTVEGGPERYEAGLVSLRPMSAAGNRGAGGFLGAFYAACGIDVGAGRKFGVFAFPRLPTSGFICALP
jgi:hypothetical protein